MADQPRVNRVFCQLGSHKPRTFQETIFYIMDLKVKVTQILLTFEIKRTYPSVTSQIMKLLIHLQNN